MDALVTYGLGSEESDNDEQHQGEKQANSRKEGDISREIPVSGTSTITTMDLPPSSRVPLPLELNCEIFKCLKLSVQRKFIWGMGRDIYGIFGQKLLKKTKRLCNPVPNGWNWNRTTTHGIRTNIYAEKGFAISVKHSRADSFPGTIIYYYEVKLLSKAYSCDVGFSNGTPKGECIGDYPNSYAIPTGYPCIFTWYRLAGKTYHFQFPDGAIQPKQRDDGVDTYGCGLVLDPNDKLAIFFTVNGILMGRQAPISPTLDEHIFPTVTSVCGVPTFEANFGNDKDKPFEYDIKKCPGMGLASN